MPFSIDSITFADEFNTGTTNQFISANVGDEITTTIQISYSNIIDASGSGSLQIAALDSSYIEKDIEENPDKYPVESRDMIIKEIEELKRKATPEYVYQERFS
jgi:hypothetical protein